MDWLARFDRGLVGAVVGDSSPPTRSFRHLARTLLTGKAGGKERHQEKVEDSEEKANEGEEEKLEPEEEEEQEIQVEMEVAVGQEQVEGEVVLEEGEGVEGEVVGEGVEGEVVEGGEGDGKVWSQQGSRSYYDLTNWIHLDMCQRAQPKL